jgi:hypothetical protein
MKIIGSDVIFESTGIKQYANCGIIGLSPDLGVTGGYDDSSISRVWEGKKEEERELNKREREELADYMISLWQKYKTVTSVQGGKDD